MDGGTVHPRSELRRTQALLALAAFVILPLTLLTLRSSFAFLFPRCNGLIERVEEPTPPRNELNTLDATIALDGVLYGERDGLRLHLDTEVNLEGQVSWARMVGVGVDERGRTCECGGVLLRDQSVSTAGGDVHRASTGTYYYVDAKWGPASPGFRVVEGVRRHFQRDRFFARRQLPAAVALVGVAFGVLAAVRMRRSRVEAIKVSWNEARLVEGGRVESEGGDVLGVVQTGDASTLPAGTILVAPGVVSRRGTYRDLPVLTLEQVAGGSRASRLAASLHEHRNARALAVIAVVCAAVGLAADVVRPWG